MQRINRFLKPSDNSFFLFGPRGTGKTLWTRQTFGDALVVDLLSPEVFREYIAFPERLRELVSGRIAHCGDERFAVVIDEVQRVPELLDVVHGLIVEYPQMRFILTGSSARKIRKRGVNLLGGRASARAMHPFMAAEMGEIFSLAEAVDVGMLPVIWGTNNRRDALKAYVGTYLEEEVRHEGILRNAGSFARFLEVASFSHGSVPNMAAIARECAISAPTARTYFDILSDLLLSFTVPVFSRRAQRTLATKSKFYIFDAGVYNALRPRGPLDRPADIAGPALEGLIAQHLRAWCDLSGSDAELFHWRTKFGVEVDFILYGSDVFAAIEVKHSGKVRDEHLSGLRAFGEDYPEARLCLLHCGQETRKIGNVLCLPCEEFLRELRPGNPPVPGTGQ